MTTSRSRIIGTAGESAVVKVLRASGWPQAERRQLRGQLDAGDITGCPGLCFSVKSGEAAKTASDGQVQVWLDELDKQRVNAGADVGVLVLQRRGIGVANAGRWWAVMAGGQYHRLSCAWQGPIVEGWDPGPLRMHLSQACALLTYAGYGGGTEVADGDRNVAEIACGDSREVA